MSNKTEITNAPLLDSILDLDNLISDLLPAADADLSDKNVLTRRILQVMSFLLKGTPAEAELEEYLCILAEHENEDDLHYAMLVHYTFETFERLAVILDETASVTKDTVKLLDKCVESNNDMLKKIKELELEMKKSKANRQ